MIAAKRVPEETLDIETAKPRRELKEVERDCARANNKTREFLHEARSFLSAQSVEIAADDCQSEVASLQVRDEAVRSSLASVVSAV